MGSTEIGQVVHYTLSQNDVQKIQQQRQMFQSHDLGYLASGADVRSGEVFPAIIVKTYSADQASLKVMLDGPDELWTASKSTGDAEGQWQYPEQSSVGGQRQKQTTSR